LPYKVILAVVDGYTGDNAVLETARRLASLLKGPSAIAWNGSLEADRALGAALPLIAEARAAVVFLGEEEGRRVPDIAGLKGYLKRQGIDARVIEAKLKGAEVGAYLMNGARDTGAGTLVIGA
jgi:nucleotide-binding universal stress UspA family protein